MQEFQIGAKERISLIPAQAEIQGKTRRFKRVARNNP
jgi:hypothetical protein